ncbi:hypothetical protein Tco_0830302 [Tanacetum coccineum]
MPTVALENGTVRPKTYEELSDKEKLQADCDLKATNIILQGLPPDVYALVNHYKVSKDIWDRFKLLMQGTSLSKQERECKLYDEFDKFSYVKGETLHQYYLRLAVPIFLLGDDPIAYMNKSMAFLSGVFTPRYPSTNNQLKSSSNMRNQATVQDGRVTVQQVLGRQGEGHMARQCTQPKRRRDATWFKEKVLLVQAHVEGKELDEEQLAFLADPGVTNAKAVLMANLSSCDSDVCLEDKANNESKIVNESLTAELERYKERVKILKQIFNVDLSSREKFIDSQMDDMIRMKNKKESKSTDKEIVLENKNKELENIVSIGYQNPFYLKRAQRIKPILYDGNVLSKTHDVLYMVDEEETLILAEESQLKMVEKQNDPIMKKEKINMTPINYSELNKLAEDFGKRFVPQQELPTEQMFWLQSSNKNSEEPSTSNTPINIKVPSELPKFKDFFKEFDKGLHDEITEIQTVFTQMEATVEQCSVDRKCCKIQKKQFLIENDRLLDKIITQEVVNIVLNSSVIICDSEKENVNSVDTCNKCLELEDELVKKNNVYIELSKWFSNLKQHCISLEVVVQLNK